MSTLRKTNFLVLILLALTLSKAEEKTANSTSTENTEEFYEICENFFKQAKM